MSNLGNKIFEGMKAIGDEEKEACIHCKTFWYRIHHNDGRCHKCVKKGLPGRSTLEKRKAIANKIYLGIILASLLITTIIAITSLPH